MIRLFAAVAVPEATAAILTRTQHGLPAARWRDPASFHITLRYVGETPETIADDLDAELAALSEAAFAIEIAGAGAFEDETRIRSIWAGVRANPALDRLAGRCEAAARRAGLKAVKRPFRAHVTLAYLRDVGPDAVGRWIAAHNLIAAPPFEVRSFGLYSSHPTAEGSHYRLERRYPLRDKGEGDRMK